MNGKRRYEKAVSSLAQRKEDKPLYFSGQLGLTTKSENQIEVPGRNGYVWVRLRNQLNEVIQAFNDSVSLVFDLPVMVVWDILSPTRYRVIGRDIGRYSDWGSSSSYLPVHGAQHSFNTLTGIGGGDIVWVYSQQFQPLLITPSGSAGSFSVSIQPHVYYWNSEFQYAGGTGFASFAGLEPTGSSSARMYLLYLDPDTGNVNLATGSLTEFSNSLTGTADVIPYVPSLISPEDIPLAAVRMVTGTSTIQWSNLYDIRTYFASAGGAYGGSGAPANAQYVTMASNPTLSDERILTAGADIDIADGGAGGNVTVSVETGTFSRPGHSHVGGVGGVNELPIYEDHVFVATGTILDFGTNVNVEVTGTILYISTVDTQGGGGSDLLIYDASAFKVTGSAVSFDDNLTVHVTGSIAYIDASGASGDSVFTGDYASRPSPSNDGDLFLPTDSPTLWRSTGSAAWIPWGPLFRYEEPPDLSSFSWINSGTSNVVKDNGTIYLNGQTVGADHSLRMQVLTAPAAPWTLTACILPLMWPQDFNHCGILVRDNSSGTVHTLSYLMGNSAQWQSSLFVSKYDDATNLNANYISQSFLALATNYPIWMRLNNNDTSLISSLSMDGQNWMTAHSTTKDDFVKNHDQLGFYVSGQGYPTVWDNVAMTLLSWKIE